MSRLVPAAQQLIEEVNRLGDKMSVKPAAAPDGFGAIRSIEFDAATSKWLPAVLNVIDDDRVESIDYAGKGRAVVNFVPDARADHKDDFEIARVKAVFDGE